jgi:hypothetical protein
LFRNAATLILNLMHDEAIVTGFGAAVDEPDWGPLERRRMRHSDAIEQAFSVHWLLSHASEEERNAVRQALDAAWEGGNGDISAGAHILPSSPACGFRRLP